jgi:hypothetical protein
MMKLILENWREYLNEGGVSEKDLYDAIEHADIYGDQKWTLEDFDIEYLGELTPEQLEYYDDLSSWVEVDEEEEDIESYRGKEWADRAKKWKESGIPPIVIISAPEEGKLHTQIGDGRGRVNFAVAHQMSVPAYHMKWRDLK